MSLMVYIGCKSTHGGVILTGDPTMLICGYPVARIEDLHACPQSYPGPVPHSITKIVRGQCNTPRGTISGDKEIAVVGDLTECGAVLQPGDCPATGTVTC